MIEYITNNVALAGLLGVTIGALISGMIAFIQSFLNNKHDRYMYHLRAKEENNKLLNESKKKAYVDFLDMLERKRMMLYAKEKNNVEIYNSSTLDLVENSQHVTAVYSLLASQDLLLKGVELFNRCDEYVMAGSYNEVLGNLLTLMKKDLEIGV